MRKVLFLSLLLIAVTGLASADTISFSGMTNGTLTSSGSNIPVDTWSSSLLMGFPSTTLDFNASGGTASIAGLFTNATFTSSDLTLNTCDGLGGIGSDCDITIAGSNPFMLDASFFSTLVGLGYVGPNSFTLSGFIQGKSLDASGTYTVDSWGLDAVQAPVPEPASVLLLGSGLLMAAGSIRRKINL